MVSLFAWNDSFLTHLDSVDAQHHRLVRLINDLAEMALSSNEISPTAFASVRDRVVEYAQLHFRDEENLMQAAALDKCHVEQHLADHQAFIAEAQHLSDIGKERVAARTKALTEYLIHWLGYHILNVDQSMARQIHAIEAGATPAEAFAAELQRPPSHTEPSLAAMSGLYYVASEHNSELRELNCKLEERLQVKTQELERAQAKLQEMSTHDDLTGLPNRRLALLNMEKNWLQYKRYGHALTVLAIDVDHFKKVNDHFGRAQGDALLRAVTARLKKSVRDSDIVCRLGGDEFLILCYHCNKAGAQKIVKKIRRSSTDLFTPEGVKCWDGSLSIGVAETDDDMENFEDLLLAADKAMHADKKNIRALTGH